MAITRPQEFPKHKKNDIDLEYEVFEQLKANLSDDAIVVYEPMVWDRRNQQYRPDFVVFSHEAGGTVVIEAKRWAADGIQGTDGNLVQWSDGTKRKHPFKAADDYKSRLMGYLSRRGRDNTEIVHQTGNKKGKLVFPTVACVMLVGTKDADLPKWAEKLDVPEQVLLSSETANDRNRLSQFLRLLPKPFVKKNLEARTMRLAADTLSAAGDTERTVDEIGQCLSDLDEFAKRSRDEDQMTAYARNRQLLGLASDKIAGLIASHADGDEESGVVVHPSANELAEISSDLAEQKFLVGMFGTTAAGKSTLTNALVHDAQLLREDLGETTRVITRIRPADPDSGLTHRTTVLRYKTAKQLRENTTSYLSLLGTKAEDLKDLANSGLGDPAFRELVRDQIRQWEKSESPTIRNAVGALNELLSGWDDSKNCIGEDVVFAPEHFDEADARIHRPNLRLACYVHERIVYHDNAFTENGIELVDAPGVGANIQDTNRALGIAQKADAFLLVTSVGFKFMQADQDFLKDLSKVLQDDAKENLLFILNKIQMVEPEPDMEHAVNEQQDLLRSKLDEHGFGESKILPVDARAGHYARLAASGEDAAAMKKFRRARFPDFDSPDENIRESRLNDLEKVLIDHLVDRKYSMVIDSNLLRMQKAVRSYEKHLEKQIADRKRSVEELKKQRAVHEMQKNETKDHLSEFLEITFPAKVNKLFDQQLPILIDEMMTEIQSHIESDLKYALKDTEAGTAEVVRGRLEGEIDSFIEQRIEKLREKLESEYRSIKEHALDKRIPGILKNYGDNIDWHLHREDIEEEKTDSMKGLQALIPGWMARFYLWWTWKKNYPTVVAKWVAKTFDDSCREAFQNRMVQWCNKDMESMCSQTENHFEKLMRQIDGEIAFAIQEMEKHVRDTEAYEHKLQFYDRETRRIDKRLCGLKRELENRRPKELALA